jgi:hypothetical protein
MIDSKFIGIRSIDEIHVCKENKYKSYLETIPFLNKAAKMALDRSPDPSSFMKGD